MSLIFLLLFLPALAAAPAQEEPGLKSKLEKIFGTFLQRELTIEKMRWRFPAHYTGYNLRLWESPGVLMAEAPKATMKVSLWNTMISRRFRISEISGKNLKTTLRYWHDGKTNYASMVKDLVDHANKTRVYGQRQKAVYNLFRIEDSQMEVLDAATGNRPFDGPFRLDATGDIDGLGPQTEFDFHLKAVHSSTRTPTVIELNGTMSNRPRIHIEAKKLPLNIVDFYLPVIRQFSGDFHSTFDFSKAGGYKFWKLGFNTDNIKAAIKRPFPVIAVNGFFHPYAASVLKIVLQGKPTRLETVMRVSDLKSKKAALALKSTDADIAECIDWLRTGYFMKMGPHAPAPVVWKISGKASIDAQLTSVLGPELLDRINGQIELKLREGALEEMPGFSKSFSLLNLSALLLKRGDKTGLEFSEVKGIIDIADGVATTRGMILLEGSTIDIGVTGRINFPRQAINARMLIGIINVPENIVKRIPGVQRFQDGQQRRVVPIWLAIQGPLANPNIRVLPLRTVDRDIWKTLPPSFRLPEKEIQQLYQPQP